MKRPKLLSIALDAGASNVDAALYATTVSVSGGAADHGRASGVARSDDGVLALDLRMPRDLGGDGMGTNPEQLFAAGYAACFHGALVSLAERHGIAVRGATVDVTVSFRRDPVDGLFTLAARVSVRMPGVAPRLARQLLRNAERICPYTKMVRQGIESSVVLDPGEAAPQQP